MIPENRLRVFNQGKGSGECVVYWMISARRTRWNHGLQHAIDLANERNLPLVVVEALAIAHQWANDGSHTFVIQGMMDNKNHKEYMNYFKNISSLTTIDIPNQPNAINGKELKKKLNRFHNVRYKKTIEEAIKSIPISNNDIILITGSLYLAGEVLNLN